MTETQTPATESTPIETHTFEPIPNETWCAHCGKYKEDCERGK